MKPIPTLEELTETAQRDAKHVIYSAKTEQLIDSATAPLFAAIQERDEEIERLRGLLADIRDMPEIDQDDAHRLRHKAQYALGTTEPEPAKPETFEFAGKVWFKHGGHPPLPCDPEAEINWLLHSELNGAFPYRDHKMKAKRLFPKLDVAGWRYADEAKPDPYAYLREAEAQGKVIEVNAGTEERPLWRSVKSPMYNQPPEEYRVKPWTLPPPPKGESWHRTDWTEEMLHPGERPLLLGEKDALGDEEFINGEGLKITRTTRYGTTKADFHTRTRRPLPEPEVWVDLGPEDCPPGSVLRAIDSKNQGWLSIQAAYTDGVRYTGYTESKETYFRSYSQLATTHQINRSLSTGKWDPNAWEPCRKLFK